MKKNFFIIYSIDIALCVLLTNIYLWWKENYHMPGLAEMYDGDIILTYMFISYVVLVGLTIVLLIKLIGKNKKIKNF